MERLKIFNVFCLFADLIVMIYSAIKSVLNNYTAVIESLKELIL